MQMSDSIVIVVSYSIRSNFRFALAVLKRKIFTAAASVQGGLSCSIKNSCKLRDNMSKSLFEKFQPNLWLANLMLDGTPVQVAAKQIGTKT